MQPQSRTWGAAPCGATFALAVLAAACLLGRALGAEAGAAVSTAAAAVSASGAADAFAEAGASVGATAAAAVSTAGPAASVSAAGGPRLAGVPADAAGPDGTSAQLFELLNAFRAETRADRDERNERDAARDARFAVFMAETRADRDERDARFAVLMEDISELKAVGLATKASVDEILESSPTISSAERVAACATNAVFFVAAPISCSAFAYVPPDAPPGPASVFLTAAHCLTGPKGENWTSHVMQLHRTIGGDPLHCAAERVFPSPEDAAILVCAGAGATATPAAAGASALSRAGGSPRLGLSVVAAGFVADAFSGTPMYSLPFDSRTTIKLTFAHVSNTAGHWNNESCDVAHTGSATRPTWSIEPGGFFDGLVTRGMSGGPLLSLRCVVIGIIHGKGCESSIFARLDAVDEYLRGNRSGRPEAEAAAKAAAEAAAAAVAAALAREMGAAGAAEAAEAAEAAAEAVEAKAATAAAATPAASATPAAVAMASTATAADASPAAATI